MRVGLYRLIVVAGLVVDLLAWQRPLEAAATREPSLAYQGRYQGNPNPTISSIAAAIECSRSGPLLTPAFVQCSARPTTASGSNNPYEDLEYSWNFGDAAGTENFEHPISGATVNANSQQWGPEATYVYRKPGIYTITLNVRGCGNGPAANGTCAGDAYISATARTSITVDAFSARGTYYYDAAGRGTICSLALPCAITQFTRKLANNTQHFFNCGETFTGTGANGLIDFGGSSLSNVRLAAGGSKCPGATPVLKVDSGANTRAMFLQGGGTKGQTKKDIVISNIFFTDGGTATINSGVCEILAGGGPGALTDVYLDMKDGGGCTDTLGAGGIQNLNIQPSTTNFFNIAIWGGTFSSPLTGTNCIGILGGAQQWYSIVGTSVTGNGNADPIRCHHIYVHAQRHVLVRWNRGGNSDPTGISPTRNYTIKTSYDNSEDGVPPGGFYAEYFLVSENRLHGTTFGLNISNKFNNPLATRFKYYVDQQDIYDHLPGKGATGIIQPWAAETLTVRDARACNSGDIWFTPNGSRKPVFVTAQIYRNQIYDQGNAGIVVFTDVLWGSGSPLKQIVTDNIFYGAHPAAILNEFGFSDWKAAGSVVDRNRYFAPNAPVQFLFNGRSGMSFAKWQSQGWDEHGSAGAGPAWPKPESCDFGTWPYN